MEMQMEHALARVGADIGDDPIAAQAAGSGNGSKSLEQGGQELTVVVGIGQLVRRTDVASRDGQEVRGRSWVDVAEDNDAFVLVNALGRQLLRSDAAEQAPRVVGRVALRHVRSLGDVTGPRQDGRIPDLADAWVSGSLVAHDPSTNQGGDPS